MPGTRARIPGSARINMSWPLRATSRETQATTGASPRPYRRRTAARAPGSGRNRSASMPGGRGSSAAVGPNAAATRPRV